TIEEFHRNIRPTAANDVRRSWGCSDPKGVSLVTFFAPAKKVTRWPEGTVEALFDLRIGLGLDLRRNKRQTAKSWIPAFAGMTRKKAYGQKQNNKQKEQRERSSCGG